MEYQSLSSEEKAHYERLGLLGTIANRHGHASFGPRVRSKVTAVAKPHSLPGSIDEVSGAIILQDAERQEAELLPLEHVLAACTAKPFPTDLKEFKDELNASLKANRLDKSGQAGQASASADDILVGFEAASGTSASATALSNACAAGGLGSFSSSEWVPVPGNGHLRRFDWNTPARKFSEAGSWQLEAAGADDG